MGIKAGLKLRTAPVFSIGATVAQSDFNKLKLFGRFFEEGWVSKLTPTQGYVWLAMLNHANIDGEAWPSAARVARYIGHAGLVRVHAAKTALTDAGLLQVLRAGGGRNRTTVFRVCLPPAASETVADLETVAEMETVADLGANTVADLVNKPLPIRQPEQIREQERREQKRGEAPIAASVPLPGGLRASPFVEAWTDWLAHRVEIGKPLTERQARLKLEELSEFTVDQATKAVRDATAGGYQTIYTDRIKRNGKHDNGRREFADIEFANFIPTVNG